MIFVKYLISLCLVVLFLLFMISAGAGLTSFGLLVERDSSFRGFLTIVGHSLPAFTCAALTYYLYTGAFFKSTRLSSLVIAPICVFYIYISFVDGVFDISWAKSMVNFFIFL